MKTCPDCGQPVRADGVSWRSVAAEEEERANDNAAVVVAAQAFIDEWVPEHGMLPGAFERLYNALVQAHGEQP